jgi:hypothetical protein
MNPTQTRLGPDSDAREAPRLYHTERMLWVRGLRGPRTASNSLAGLRDAWFLRRERSNWTDVTHGDPDQASYISI